MNGLICNMGWHSSQYVLATRNLLNRVTLCPICRVVETQKMILLVGVSLAQGINMYHSQCIQMASTKPQWSAGLWEQFHFLMHSNAPEWKIRATQFLLQMVIGAIYAPISCNNRDFMFSDKTKCKIASPRFNIDLPVYTLKNIARIANAVQVTICLLVSTSVY